MESFTSRGVRWSPPCIVVLDTVQHKAGGSVHLEAPLQPMSAEVTHHGSPSDRQDTADKVHGNVEVADALDDIHFACHLPQPLVFNLEGA